jgi:branched-chain amino acid transport system permease protein
VRRIGRDRLILAVLVVGFLCAPAFLGGSQLQVAVRILVFATLGVAWNVMGGFAGLFSFGHAAFFGLGAYVSAFLLIEHDISPWIGLLAGAAAAAVYGVLMTWLVVRYRLRGAYFALATFAFAEMLHLVSLNMSAINGTEGLRVPILPGESLWMMQFSLNSPKYLYVMLFLFAVSMIVVIQMTRSRLGYRLRAMRDDPESAAAAGIDVQKHALIATAISAALTAVAGAFYVQFLFFVDPPLAFGPQVSVQILLPAIVGGVATIWGPVVGAAVIVVLGELLARLIASPPAALAFLEGRSGLDLVIYGALLVVIIMYAPKGLYGTLARWRNA